MAGEQAAPMGRLSHGHVQLFDRPQQALCSVACGGGINVAAFDSEVFPEGGGTGGKEGVQDGPTVRRYGCRHLGGHPINVPPVVSSCLGGGLGIRPN